MTDKILHLLSGKKNEDETALRNERKKLHWLTVSAIAGLLCLLLGVSAPSPWLGAPILLLGAILLSVAVFRYDKCRYRITMLEDAVSKHRNINYGRKT